MMRWLLGILTCCTVAGLLYFTHISNHQKPLYRVLITHRGGIGELEMAERIKHAGKSLRLEIRTLHMQYSHFLTRFWPQYSEQLARLFQPDIVISLQGDTSIFYPHAKHYLAMTHGSSYYKDMFTNLPRCDALLVSFPDHHWIQEMPFMPWFTTCGKTEFTPPTRFRLFYCGCNMANTLNGLKYRQLFTRLDKMYYLNVHGKQEEWHHTPNSYRGFIPSNGDDLLKIMNQTGVSLVLHTPDHLYGQTPTAKIFEAAASSTVIIADRNPFIEKEFGNAILYIDQELPTEALFQQIHTHMQWIQTHPQEALDLARKAHAIFVKKFTLEAQLERLIQLHQTLTGEKS